MALNPITHIKKHLAKRNEKRLFKQATTEEVFTHIYRENKWGDKESVSGKGSNLEVTAGVREALPEMLEKLQVQTLLDIPCGDFHWMKEIELGLDHYMGADIVKPLVEENQRLYGNEKRQFQQLDLIRDPLPEVDVIFCRECLVHLSFADINRALDNIARSGSTYLFTTQFPEIRKNEDVVTGKHHSLNFTLAPFKWPEPMLQYIEYQAGKRRGDKCLSVWKIADLPIDRFESTA